MSILILLALAALLLFAVPSPPVHGQIATPTPTPFTRAQPNAEFQPLQRGVPILSTLDANNSVDRFAVFAAAGDQISFGMFPEEGSALSPRFEVFAPNGERVAQASGQFAAVIGYQVPATGAYIVFARPESGSGAYSFWVNSGEMLRDVARGSLMPDQAVQGEILRRADRDLWRVTLRGGTPIEIALTPDDPTLNLMLEIIAPDGTLLTAVLGGDVPLLYLPSDGEYTLRLFVPQAAARGTYTLRLRLLGALPTPTFGSVTG